MATETITERALALHRAIEEEVQQEIAHERLERYERRKAALLSRIQNILGEAQVTFLDPISHPDPDYEHELFPLARVENLLISFSLSKTGIDLCRPCPICGELDREPFFSMESLGRLLSREPGPCKQCDNEPTEQPRDNYLESLGVRDLRERAHELLPEISAVRTEANALKERIAHVEETLEMAEAGLMMSDAYSAGKNAEIRKAWLIRQRNEDAEYSAGWAARDRLRWQLATAEAQLEAKSHELSVVLAEMRLVSAQLEFLAGGERDG